ncbi:hypothetical protein Tco_1027281 [Tanacetum coccineum]
MQDKSYTTMIETLFDNTNPEEDPTDYTADGGDDDYDDDESSDDDEDDDVEEDKDEEEEEEHLALAYSIPPPVHRVTARMSVRAQTPISLPLNTEVARLLAIPTPPPSPLSTNCHLHYPKLLSPTTQILSPHFLYLQKLNSSPKATKPLQRNKATRRWNFKATRRTQLAANGYQTAARNKATRWWNFKATRRTQLAAKQPAAKNILIKPP